jgi:hypothetical protein
MPPCRREIRDCLERIKTCKRDFARYDQATGDLEQAESKLSQYLNEIEQQFKAKAGERGITILEVPVVDMRTLLQMSLDCVPPFEDSQSEGGDKTKEKGFRDALIMFTVLENIRNRPTDNALIVTRDKRLGDGLKRLLSEYQTRLDVVDTLDDAIAFVYKTLEAIYRERFVRSADEAKEMLLSHRQQISDAVRQVRELSEIDLGQGYMAGVLGGRGSGERLSVDEVQSLMFDSVELALWKDKDKPVSRILFRIRCLARVIGTPVSPRLFWDPTIFTVGGERQSTIRLGLSDGPPVQKELPVALYGEASFEKTETGNWKLVNVKVDKSLPPMEEWKEFLTSEKLIGRES